MEASLLQEIQTFASNHTIMVVAWIALFFALAFNIFQAITDKYKTVETPELTNLINKSNGVVLDLRSDEEYKKGHISTAVHILPNDIKLGRTNQIDKYKDVPVIIVDNDGLTSGKTANILAKQGFNQVFVLKEGMISWNNEKLPLVKK